MITQPFNTIGHTLDHKLKLHNPALLLQNYGAMFVIYNVTFRSSLLRAKHQQGYHACQHIGNKSGSYKQQDNCKAH